MRGLDALADHSHIAIGHGSALAAEFLRNLLPHFLQNRRRIGTSRDLVHVAGDGADEGNTHHAGGQLRCWCILLGHGKRVDDEEADLPVTDGLARLDRQLGPDLFGAGVRLQDESAARHQPEQRIGVAEDFVVGRNHDFHVFQFGVGDLDRLRTQRDVVVGRRAALLGPILGRRLGVHAEHAGQDVGQQLSRGDRAVATDRMKTHAKARVRQQLGIGLGLQRHRFGLGIGGLQSLQQFGDARRRRVGEELGTQIDQRHQLPVFHVLERCDQMARLQVVPAQAKDGGRQQRALGERRDAGVAHLAGIFACLEQGLRDEAGKRGLVRALQHGHGLLALERLHQFSFREGL